MTICLNNQKPTLIMVQIRQGAETSKNASKDASKDASKAQDLNNKENEPPAGTPLQQHNKAPVRKTGSKRKSGLEDRASNDTTPKKRKTSGASKTAKPTKKDENETDEAEEQNKGTPKPRLTTPDLEFDHDRFKLRDPRPTPGRDARPRYSSVDIPGDLKTQLEATQEIPEPEKPKGRLNAAKKNDLFIAEARMNPLKSFHALYRCYDKGRDGSPTYDDAGFQLDYDKVADWMKPRPYSKKRMVNGMDKAMQRDEQRRKEMFALFFEKTESELHLRAEGVMKDQVSKDIGVPWHQIGPGQVKVWRDKGFKPVKYEEWWTEPTEEDEKREGKMLRGASLRKHI
jgi:hypothetical protein